MSVIAPPESRRDVRPLVSLIVPVLNEEESIGLFLERVEATLGRDVSLEYVFVNDGSVDGTLRCLLEAGRPGRLLRIVSLSRNFGKEAALTAGIDHAQGDVLVPIDVDLQDPPEVILKFIARWQEGYDVVFGLRMSRAADGALKRWSAGLFYRLFNRFSSTRIPPNAGDFRLFDKRVAAVLRHLPERNRFMKGLFAWAGFKTACVPYERPARAAGTTKWNYWRLWNFALDGIVGFSTLPLRTWSYVGAVTSLLAFLYAAFIVARTLLHGADVPGYASLVTIVLFLGGLQLLSVGVMGEYIGRLITEVKGRPIYVVDRVHEVGATQEPEPKERPSACRAAGEASPGGATEQCW